VWDEQDGDWVLKTAVEEGGEPAVDSLGREVSYANYGLMFVPETVEDDPSDGSLQLADVSRFKLTPVNRWGGQLTPTFIQGQEVGPSVVQVRELWAARYRADFRTELWRRSCVWMTGLVLVLGCVPLVLGREGRSRGLGIGFCILFGIAYILSSTVVPDITQSGLPEPYDYIQIPPWSPLVPHAFFLVVGLWSYLWYMET